MPWSPTAVLARCSALTVVVHLKNECELNDGREGHDRAVRGENILYVRSDIGH